MYFVRGKFVLTYLLEVPYSLGSVKSLLGLLHVFAGHLVLGVMTSARIV